MKLIKLSDKSGEATTFVIDGFELEFNGKIYKRTNRIYGLIKCYNIVLNGLNGDHSYMQQTGFMLSENELLIYELEFDKLEDLIHLIPEEFL